MILCNSISIHYKYSYLTTTNISEIKFLAELCGLWSPSSFSKKVFNNINEILNYILLESSKNFKMYINFTPSWCCVIIVLKSQFCTYKIIFKKIVCPSHLAQCADCAGGASQPPGTETRRDIGDSRRQSAPLGLAGCRAWIVLSVQWKFCLW